METNLDINTKGRKVTKMVPSQRTREPRSLTLKELLSEDTKGDGDCRVKEGKLV